MWIRIGSTRGFVGRVYCRRLRVANRVESRCSTLRSTHGSTLCLTMVVCAVPLVGRNVSRWSRFSLLLWTNNNFQLDFFYFLFFISLDFGSNSNHSLSKVLDHSSIYILLFFLKFKRYQRPSYAHRKSIR